LSDLDDDELRDLRLTARGFFAKYSGEEAVRAAMDSDDGFDRTLWTAMADQLGLVGLLVPENFGGTGFGFKHLQIVMEEMGRALVCAPYLSTAVLAVSALLASGDDERCAQLLPRIADGSSIAAVAFTDRRGRWVACGDDVRARANGAGWTAGWTLTGARPYVLDGAAADLVLVAAATDDGPGLFAVDAAAGGYTATPVQTLDLTRRQANVTFEHTDATVIGTIGAAEEYLNHAVNAALAALTAEQVGGARRLLEMSVEYAQVREQFGRPIGSFQAIKHKCADMLVEVESSTSAAYAACAAIEEGSAETALLCSLAKAYCSEAYCHVAAENIQVHGGIGFTWEHPAHLYFRRAKSSEMLLGTPAYHRERVLKELGL
jgi:alkylation response protein AidB-like acyl-CoA dehydrogenase